MDVRKREYKTVCVPTKQGWGGSKGSVDNTELDAALNAMASDGWELVTIEDLKHTAGTSALLCVFSRTHPVPR